jgi:hypothetical protein
MIASGYLQYDTVSYGLGHKGFVLGFRTEDSFDQEKFSILYDPSLPLGVQVHRGSGWRMSAIFPGTLLAASGSCLKTKVVGEKPAGPYQDPGWPGLSPGSDFPFGYQKGDSDHTPFQKGKSLSLKLPLWGILGSKVEFQHKGLFFGRLIFALGIRPSSSKKAFCPLEIFLNHFLQK